jgi:hypothetical protein
MANAYNTITVQQVFDAITAQIATNNAAITTAQQTVGIDPETLVQTIQAAEANINYATAQQQTLQTFVDANFFPPSS